jgi:disulfide oxidoreductase YuzD
MLPIDLQGCPMTKDTSFQIRWLDDVEIHDNPAAESYLCLLYAQDKAREIVRQLRGAAFTAFKAKDIFRASQLSLLGVSNSHVEKDSEKIESGKQLSPLLLVRDEAHGRALIADGYHRLCAVYLVNEDALIHCKIV